MDENTKTGPKDSLTPVIIRQFEERDCDQVIHVWRESGLTNARNDPHKDIARKVGHSEAGLLVAEVDGAVVGTVMVGYEGHRGWINYLGVLPVFQGLGLGTQLLVRAEADLRELGCAKINLQIRTSNQKVIDFYHSLGYSLDDCVSMGKRLEFD